MTLIVDKYRITFRTARHNNTVIPIADSDLPGCGILCNYLCEWYRPGQVQELIDLIDDILAEAPDADNVASSDAAMVEIDKDKTMFWQWLSFDRATPAFTIPTSDFKEILYSWKAFLEKL